MDRRDILLVLSLAPPAPLGGPAIESEPGSGTGDDWPSYFRVFCEELGLDDDRAAEGLSEAMEDPSEYEPFDDVMSTLEHLSEKHVSLGIISNFERTIHDLLNHHDLSRFFEVVVASSEVEVRKPDPELFHLALERAGRVASAVVHVGDSPELDMAPAASAGMRAILLDRGGRFARHRGPRITSLTDLPAVLKL